MGNITGGYVDLNRDFHEFLKSIVRHDVCSLAIGGRNSGRFQIGFGPSGLASERCFGEKRSIDEMEVGRFSGASQ